MKNFLNGNAESNLSAVDVVRGVTAAGTINFICPSGSNDSDQELDDRKHSTDDCQYEESVYLNTTETHRTAIS